MRPAREIDTVRAGQIVGRAERPSRPCIHLKPVAVARIAVMLQRPAICKIGEALFGDPASLAGVGDDPPAQRDNAVVAEHPGKANGHDIAHGVIIK